MKTIQEVQIWDNGIVKIGKVLNAFAVNVSLNQSATFYYELLPLKEDGSTDSRIAYGNVFMPTEQYLEWDQDEFAWDFIAGALNLVITGEYIIPQPVVEVQPMEESPVEDEPKSEENI